MRIAWVRRNIVVLLCAGLLGAWCTARGGVAKPDSVKGHGSITGTPSGGEADFDLDASAAPTGSLRYVDANAALDVQSTAITGYAVDPNDADCRIVDYNVTINGNPGSARTRVCDKGKGGDIFQIQLSNGYFAGGTLTSGKIKLRP